MSEKAQAHVEQLLHIADVLFIHKEQNHVIAGFDHRVVVGDQHFFVTNDRADGGTRRQCDVFDGLADHLAGLRVAVSDCLDGLSRAAAQ